MGARLSCVGGTQITGSTTDSNHRQLRRTTAADLALPWRLGYCDLCEFHFKAVWTNILPKLQQIHFAEERQVDGQSELFWAGDRIHKFATVGVILIHIEGCGPRSTN